MSDFNNSHQTDSLYQEELLDLAQNPQNYGELTDADITHTETNASCGDYATVMIKISDDKKILEKVSWTGSGCIMSRAALSVLAPAIEGKEINEVQRLSQDDVLNLLGLPTISPGRRKCIMLGLSAVQQAIK